MLQHVVSLTPAVAGIVSVFVIWCIRFANLSHVAIPLHNGRITKVKVQQLLVKYFSVKVKAQQKGKVKVQQKLTKYFNLQPKAGRPGAEAPRSHRCRHHFPHHHLPMSLQCRTRSHQHHHCPTGCIPPFPLGNAEVGSFLHLLGKAPIKPIKPTRASLNVVPLK